MFRKYLKEKITHTQTFSELHCEESDCEALLEQHRAAAGTTRRFARSPFNANRRPIKINQC